MPQEQSYREVPLTRGQVAIVDAADYESLMQWKWYASLSRGTFYVKREQKRSSGKRMSIWMHRQILGLQYGEKMDVDHINGNSLDNRRANLRVVTHAENMRNRRLQKNSASGIKGVSWNKASKKWKAQIYIGGKQIHLGLFMSTHEATAAYVNAAKKYHGEFARIY
jgi:hypothetical protein